MVVKTVVLPRGSLSLATWRGIMEQAPMKAENRALCKRLDRMTEQEMSGVENASWHVREHVRTNCAGVCTA
jgi:hypothetical protein